jgi:hypothetical protein
MTAPTHPGRRALPLAMALGMLPAAAVERLRVPGIIGHDGRVLVDATEPPWQAIGRVNSALAPSARAP